jgi:hypothetical protein
MLAQLGDKKTINNSDTLKMDTHAFSSIMPLFYSPPDMLAHILIIIVCQAIENSRLKSI